jgi:hypothetical protein
MNPTVVNAVNLTLLTLNIASAVALVWFFAAMLTAEFVKTVRWFLS